MRRRIYGLLAAVCLVLAVTPVVRAAIIECNVTGGKIRFNTVTREVTGCDSSVTEANIPDKIDGVSVTSIGDEAFMHCTGLTSVSIPNSVTSIGEAAFHNCTSLTSVSILGSVTSIGQVAFMDCTSLTNVSILGSVTSIGRAAFSGCTSLTNVRIPDNVTSIGGMAFFRCTNLTSVRIPNSVTSIGDNAFYNCISLTDVYYDGTQAEYETKLLPNVDNRDAGNNRPLAKLSRAIKIANTSNEREAESEAFSTIAVTFRKDSKPFNKANGVFNKDTFA